MWSRPLWRDHCEASTVSAPKRLVFKTMHNTSCRCHTTKTVESKRLYQANKTSYHQHGQRRRDASDHSRQQMSSYTARTSAAWLQKAMQRRVWRDKVDSKCVVSGSRDMEIKLCWVPCKKIVLDYVHVKRRPHNVMHDVSPFLQRTDQCMCKACKHRSKAIWLSSDHVRVDKIEG